MQSSGDQQHTATRDLLRVVGPAVVLVGVIFAAVGLGSFFSSFGSFQPPRYFWCAFVGLPLIGLGGSICRFAYLGAVSRYMANEVAPVGKDVVNYMADGTRGAVRDMAAAVGAGLRDGSTGAQSRAVSCPQCHTTNWTSAAFCQGCGTPLESAATCRGCGKANEPNAKFCNQCGSALA